MSFEEKRDSASENCTEHNGFVAGANWARAETIQEIIEILNRWIASYPEDVFTPLPEYGTPEAAAQDATLVTRASAHMGRYMGRKLIEDVIGLIEGSK